jgi:hypothetical protein
MAVIDLSTVTVDELTSILTNFKHSSHQKSVLPFTLSGSSAAVFEKLLAKSDAITHAGRVEVGSNT